MKFIHRCMYTSGSWSGSFPWGRWVGAGWAIAAEGRVWGQMWEMGLQYEYL